MASFWLDPATNKRYNEGRAFTYNNVQYTRAGATAAKFTALGFNAVNVGARPDDRFYIVSGPANDGTYSSTARDLATLKDNFKKQMKLEARNILKTTDWLVVRLAENSDAIPAAVATFRDNIRTVADDNCTKIDACADVAALKALIDAPREVLVDPEDPAQGYQANVAGLTPNPDAVAGYDY